MNLLLEIVLIIFILSFIFKEDIYFNLESPNFILVKNFHYLHKCLAFIG